MTTTDLHDLMRLIGELARDHGWDAEWNHRDGDGITESASYDLYVDSIDGIKEHGR